MQRAGIYNSRAPMAYVREAGEGVEVVSAALAHSILEARLVQAALWRES